MDLIDIQSACLHLYETCESLTTKRRVCPTFFTLSQVGWSPADQLALREQRESEIDECELNMVLHT